MTLKDNQPPYPNSNLEDREDSGLGPSLDVTDKCACQTISKSFTGIRLFLVPIPRPQTIALLFHTPKLKTEIQLILAPVLRSKTIVPSNVAKIGFEDGIAWKNLSINIGKLNRDFQVEGLAHVLDIGIAPSSFGTGAASCEGRE